jgi:hypothetical protein
MSECPPGVLGISKEVLQHARDALNKGANAIIEQAGLASPVDLSSGSPFLDFPFDLATINTAGNAGVPANFSGYKVLYRREGSTPGGRLTFQSGGRVFRIYPGCYFTAPVSGGVLTLATNSVAAGTALFTIIKNPGYDFMEPPFGAAPPTLNPGAGGGTSTGPSGSLSQAYNSAAGNIPVLATDGLSLAGVTGVRAQIASSNGNITAANLFWWQFDTGSGIWSPTDMQDIWGLTGASVTIGWTPNDKQVWVPEGRIYAELRSATNVGGSGVWAVRLATFGNS